MTIEQRFLKYVSIDTTADDTSSTTPSSKNQFILADLLVEELKALGVENAYRDEFAYVYAFIEGTKKSAKINWFLELGVVEDVSSAVVSIDTYFKNLCSIVI